MLGNVLALYLDFQPLHTLTTSGRYVQSGLAILIAQNLYLQMTAHMSASLSIPSSTTIPTFLLFDRYQNTILLRMPSTL